MASSASVTAMTSATLTPGAVSSSVILPAGKADHRHFGHDQIDRPRRRQRQRRISARSSTCPWRRAAWRRSRAWRRVTRSIAPPMPGTILPGIIQLARCPALSTCRPPSTVTSTWPPRIRPNDMALSNVQAPGSARDRPAAGVGQQRMRHALLGDRGRCRSGRSPTGRRRGCPAGT